MTTEILVPLDGSETSARVLETLLPLAVQGESRLSLLRVLDAEEREADASAALAQVATHLRALGFETSTRVVAGDPTEQILAAAEALPADLVAMASHGRSGLTRLVRGSVAERTLRRCPVPVLLCTPRSTAVGDSNRSPFERILVPLDGSPLADRILPSVERLARLYGSEVTLLRVLGALEAPPSPVFQPKSWSAENVEAVLEPLTPQAERLAGAGIVVRRHVAYGSPAQVILEVSRGFDLIALTTHGRSGASRWLFGSVAEAVLRKARCPLLVERVVAAPAHEAPDPE